MELLCLEEVSVIRRGRPLIRDLTWRMRRGEHWVVLGPNGSGKTTLLQVAAGYLAPTSGSVRILGRRLGRVDVRDLRRRIGYAGAVPAGMVRPHLPALEVVLTGKHAAFVEARWHEYSEDDWERARHLLELMRIDHLAGRPYTTLSQGERQRTLIARSLMARPELMLLDEPAAELDLAGRELLLQALVDLASGPGGPGLVLVTHHVEDIPESFDRVLLLGEGTVFAQGPADQALTGHTLSACFGIPLEVERANGRYRAWGRG